MERAPDVSPYDRMVWADGELEQALASGTRRRDVQAYLGEQEYARLLPLAQAAARTARDPDHCVHLIPGLMGSQLGLRRGADEPPDLLWVDPTDIQRGRLTELQLGNESIESLGPVPYTHLALKLRLEAAGFTVRWFDHDWRRGIDALGTLLAARINAEPARRQLLVGHSMGGLLARAALPLAGDRIERIVTLGTPHGGSYASLQALRGGYVTVRRIMQLDPLNTTEQLTQDVFGNFPSLYQMLPVAAAGPDLRDVRQWPQSLPRPNAALLREVGRLALPAPQGKLFCVAGAGFDTVMQVALEQEQFRYFITREGDGTVPTRRSILSGHPAWYTGTLHGELPRDARVASAVIDLLLNGSTATLPMQTVAATGPTRSVTDAELREAYTQKLDWAQMTQAEHQSFFESLNAPVAAGSLLLPA